MDKIVYITEALESDGVWYYLNKFDYFDDAVIHASYYQRRRGLKCRIRIEETTSSYHYLENEDG